jgi:hypothetical protein
MEKRQQFSHSLLYSVAPENFSSLHQNDESIKDRFDWLADKSQISGDSFFRVIPDFLKITAAKWGLVQKETT